MPLLPIDRIRTDGGTQSRVQLDWIATGEYAVAMQDGAVFPPVVVFYDGTDYWLADGFHRIQAATQAGLTEFPADVRQGTVRDAVLHSVGANASHGVRRTNADKRAAVLRLLEDAEWRGWSNEEIARRTAVSSRTVSRVRSEIDSDIVRVAEEQRKGADGRTYNTANIGKRAAPTPAAPVLIPDLAPVLVAPPMPDEDEEWTDLRDVLPIVPDEVEAEPTAPAAAPSIRIINADSQSIHALNISPVHLVVTSPPYNVGIDYDVAADDLLTYIPLITSVWRQCFDVMADGARIAVVVPFGVGRNPWVPLASQVMQTLTDAGFTLRGQIIWDKNTSGNRTTWGSFRLPSDPSLRDTTEAIIVAHKGSSRLKLPADVKLKDDKGTHTAPLADSAYFMELAQDHWVVAPESAQRVKHPAPFPPELVKRLIDFYAFPGAHVLDPFGGSGTTAIAAKLTGCHATLVELSAEYCRLAEERVRERQ